MIMKGEEIKYEITESSPITFLASFGYQHFAFGMKNNFFGVYDKNTLLWKERYKEGIVGMCSIFSVEDDSEGLAVGFRNGKIETRDVVNGDVLYSFMIGGQLSGILRSQFVKSLDEEQILAIKRNGEVFGYNVIWEEQEEENQVENSGSPNDDELHALIKKLTEEKNTLKARISSVESRGIFFSFFFKLTWYCVF